MGEIAVSVMRTGEMNYRFLALFLQCLGFSLTCGFAPSLSFRRSSFFTVRWAGALALFAFTAPFLVLIERPSLSASNLGDGEGATKGGGELASLLPQTAPLLPLFQSALTGVLLGVGVSASVLVAFTAGEWISRSLFSSVRSRAWKRDRGIGVLFVFLLLSFFQESVEWVFVIFVRAGVAFQGVLFGANERGLLIAQGGEILHGALLIALPIVTVTLFLDLLLVVSERYLSPLAGSIRGPVVSLVGVFLIGALSVLTAAELRTVLEFSVKNFIRRMYVE